jgi:hypothetical protein
LLWSLRSSRPWERCGEAVTVFELAEQAGAASRQLKDYPDLLLYQFLPGKQREETGVEAILVCGRGVVLGNKVFSRPEDLKQLDVSRPSAEALAEWLRTWLKFLHEDFLPQAGKYLERPKGQAAAKFRVAEAVVCGKCGQRFLPRAGEVGIAMEGEEGQR